MPELVLRVSTNCLIESNACMPVNFVESQIELLWVVRRRTTKSPMLDSTLAHHATVSAGPSECLGAGCSLVLGVVVRCSFRFETNLTMAGNDAIL
jgi:hypothetical protein